MYDENAPTLIDKGYFPQPIAPVDFEQESARGKVPAHFVPSLGGYILLTGWNTRAHPVTNPQPGANIGVRCGGGLVVLDYDDDDAALRVSEVLPSPVNKAGARAFSSFHYAAFDVPSEDFYDANGKKVLQILSKGRQTVIPPSIHPDTKQPYRWTNGHSLYDTTLNELPLLPHDWRERIIKLGYSPSRGTEPVEVVDPETGEITTELDADTPFAELNGIAIKNLAAWVPELSIYKCRRRSGRTPSYEGVAQWRNSTTGKTLEERDLNLKISGTGIKDFGDDRGYSPLDLVMAARSCNLSEAFDWLEMRVMKSQGDIHIDLDKIIEAQDAPSIAAEPEIKTGNATGDDPDDAWVGKEWEDGDPVPAPLPMLHSVFRSARTMPGLSVGPVSDLQNVSTEHDGGCGGVGQLLCWSMCH